MKNQIKQALVDYLSKNGVDGYGQIKTLDAYSVFEDKTEEVLEWNKEHKLLSMRAYGWAYGTYKGFTVSEIKDADIKQACYESAKNNEVYRRAMTSW
jgi:hypothetical protein